MLTRNISIIIYRKLPMAFSISARKTEHFDICVNHDVEFKTIGTGFDNIRLKHCSLPELDFDEVDTSTIFLGKKLSQPLIITAMTGGFKGAEDVNKILANVCSENKIALGLGSQRQLFENSNYSKSFRVVRDITRDIPIIGNIGAAQVINQADRDNVLHMVELIEADAFAVHLNPLQEVLQPEGDTNYRGVLRGISDLVKKLPIPVIVKETGAGISGKIAQAIKDIGIHIIDISGAGGTSWAAVESYRTSNNELAKAFWDWGNPTLQCLKEVIEIEGLSVIASGGISNGIDVAKALVLGADMAGAARPFLLVNHSKGRVGLDHIITLWQQQLKIAMFLTGCRRVEDLRQVEFFDKRGYLKQDIV